MRRWNPDYTVDSSIYGPFLFGMLESTDSHIEGTLSATSMDRAFNFMLSPGLVAVTLLTAAAPLYPFFVYLRRKPRDQLDPLL